jgi:hypothetical protein
MNVLMYMAVVVFSVIFHAEVRTLLLQREQQQIMFQLQQQQNQQPQLNMQSLANDSTGSGNNSRGSGLLQLKWADRTYIPACYIAIYSYT